MLLNLIIFAIVLVALQGAMFVGFAACLFNEKFIKKYTKMMIDVAKDMAKEMEDDF